jgi:PAS domain S-box-containing protein
MTNYQNKSKEELILELQKLRLEEAQKNAILNGISSNIAFVSPDLKIIWANKSAAESVGKSPDEMIGHTCHHFWADPLEPCNNCPSLKALVSKRTEHSIMHTLDGKVWNETGEPVFDEEGNLIGIVEIATEITERARLEKSLQESELRLREVLENSLDAPYKRNLRTNDYDYMSPVFDQICGYTQEEMKFMSMEKLLELIHPDDKVTVERLIAESLSGGIGTANHLEYRFKQKDGGYRWLHDKYIVIHDSLNVPVAMIGSVSDVTDRRQAEEVIRIKSEELAKINAEKDRFFSIIAHDLRSPFNGFLGFTQLMVDELDSLTLKEIQQIAVSMRNSATNLFRLLENLLDWSLMQQGLITFNREVVQLLPIVHGSISIVQERAKNKEIEIGYQISEDLTISADVNMLMTIIRNLASNAVKFTPQGGNIFISAKVANDDNIEISIKDSGIGMSRPMVDHLFRLDDQINRTGTEGEPSTGLGLIICKDFIEKHGGKIWVDSEEGKGSTFYFSLPNSNTL